MSWPLAPVAVSVDPGSDTTWSMGERLVTEPTAVAVDSMGRPHSCGSSAVLAAARRDSGLKLCRPFTSSEIVDPAMSRVYLRWLISTAGEGHTKRVPLMLVISATARPGAVQDWRNLAESLGMRPLLVERPLAAAAGLDMESSSGKATMLVMAESEATEVAVVANGVVVMARSCAPIADGMASLATVVRSALVSIDPDQELDVVDSGIHLVGREANAQVAADLAKRVGCDVILADQPSQVVLDGARRAMETVRPYLPVLTPGAFRRWIKGGLGAFGR